MVKKKRLKNHKQVIPYPKVDPDEDKPWQFFDYSENGRNVIDEWYRALSEEGQYIFDALLKQNQKIKLPIQWGGIKMLQGECKKEKLWELRFFADDKQQRMIGIFGDKRKTAIFVIGCHHKQQIYVPPGCLDTAIKRAKAVRKGAQVSERTVESNL